MKKFYVAFIVLSFVTASFLFSNFFISKIALEKGDSYFTDIHDLWPGPKPN